MGMLTRYEHGVVKVLPMKAHLALDLVVDAVFLAAPAVLRDDDRRLTRSMVALGALGTAVALLTRAE